MSISRYQLISNKPSNEPFIHHDDHQIILRLSVAYLCIHSQGAPPWHPTIGSRNWMSRSQQSLPWIDYPKWSRAKNQLQCQRMSKVKVVVSWAANLSADQNRPKLCCYVLLWDINDSCQTLAIFGLAIVDEQCRMNNKKCRFSEFQLCFQKRTAKDTSLPCLSTTNER